MAQSTTTASPQPAPTQPGYVHRTMIVPAAYAPMARALAAASGPSASGAGMFVTMLSYDASKPPTHYLSAGMIWETFANMLPLNDYDIEYSMGRSDGHPEQVVSLAAPQGVPVTLEQVQALFNACKVYTIDYRKVMDIVGLKFVSDGAP